MSNAKINLIHKSVLKTEVLSFLAPKNAERYLDGTLGLGGHAEAILQMANCELVGLDRDQTALELARLRLAFAGERVHVVKANYKDFAAVLDALHWSCLDGALLDLGVSSMQLDVTERGFSFQSNGQLDMRMDQSEPQSAYELVNNASYETLREIIASLGEEPQASKIAAAICQERLLKPLTTTKELADLVVKAYPRAWVKKSRNHPATRTFQALRLAVNQELEALDQFLSTILAKLNTHGRLVILSFHSLEDRKVKQFMQEKAKGCICPPYSRECRCQHKPEIKILTKKPIQASAEELLHNPRARSAKLRCCVKI